MNLIENRKFELTKDKWENQLKDKDISIVKNFKELRSLISNSKQFKMRENQIYYNFSNVWQKLSFANQTDRVLIQQSLYRFKPKEVMQIKLNSMQGETLYSDFILGEKRKVSNIFEILSVIDRLREIAIKKKLWTQNIEINHTHLSFDLIKNKNGEINFLGNGLSETDLFQLKKIKQYYREKIIIKAISFSLITYCFEIDEL